MSDYIIQPTGDPPFVTCKTCDGRGYVTALKWGIDPDWCTECGGAKEIALDMSALATLAHNLATAAFGERCFDLGRFAGVYEADDWHRPEPWIPGAGLSALRSCLDCNAPLKSADAEQGMRTCEGCAGERDNHGPV